MDWMDTLKALAPTVASAMLGPLGGVAVSALGTALGIDKPTQDSIAKAITGAQVTPEQLAKIQELELQYQNDEKERGFKYAELEFKDRDSARNMAVQTKSVTPEILTYIVLIGGGAMLASVLYGYAKVDSVLAGTLIGYVVSEMKQALAFWLGTSFSSQQKTDLLAQSPAIPK